MASALSALSNASATFTVAGAGVVTDPETGNVSPANAAVTVALYLKAERQELVRYPGVDTAETLYDGYALAPLDSRVQIGTTGTLTFAGETPVTCEVKGVRLPYGKTGLLGTTLSAALGERIQLVSRGQS